MTTFTEYLRKSRYAKMDSPRGDLAQDILRDTNFPKTEDLQRISDYLETKLDPEQWKDFLAIRRAFLAKQSKQ